MGLVLAAASLVVPMGAPRAGPLDVAIEHSAALDGACALVRGYAIEPAWRAELAARRGAFAAAWARDGRPVLDRALAIAGRRLAGERTVQLTLCDVPSSSTLGPVVNMRQALASFTERPVPLRYKALVASHELLHGVVAGLDLGGSRLLAAHAAEDRRVRDHLHLLALMKAALIELERPELLAELRRLDGSLPGGAYRRAWAIVEATPTAYRAYVAEVRAARRAA